MSLDEMEGVKVRGLGIERDLYFSPKKLHEIAELEEIVRGTIYQRRSDSRGNQGRSDNKGRNRE